MQRVEGRQVETRGVALALVGAVHQVHEVAAVGDGGAPAGGPHHQFAGPAGLDVFGPGADAEEDPDLHRIHRLFPQALPLARKLAGLGGHFQHQRRAVGVVAPAVAIFVGVAVQVQQRLGLGRAVFAHFGFQAGVVATHHRRHHALCSQHLAMAQQRYFARRVVGQRQRAAQRHPLGRVAAGHGVLHAKVDMACGRVDHLAHLQTLLGQVRCQLAVGRGQADEFRWHAEQVDLAAQEGQPARLGFFDDGDFHPVQQRQLLPAQALRDGLAHRVVVCRVLVVHGVLMGRVALEHDARTALPRSQLERAGADRALHAALGVGFDDFARHRTTQAWGGQHIGQARCGLGHANLEAVAVERANARHLGVVGKRCLAVQRFLAQFAQAQQAGVLVVKQGGAAGLGVVVALDAVDVVGGHQFAPHRLAVGPLEGRVVAEVDAGFQAKDKAGVVVKNFRQRSGGVGLEAGRAGQVVVGQR